MAVNLIELKRQAIRLGMDEAKAKRSERPVLERFINKANGDRPRATKKKVVVAAGKTARPTKKVPQAEAPAPRKRGRPSNAEIAARKAAAEREEAKAKAREVRAAQREAARQTRTAGVEPKSKRPVAAQKVRQTPEEDGAPGRRMIGKVDFKITEGWNPREDSTVYALFEVLKRNKGNVQAAFEELRADVFEYVSRRKANGDRRSKADAEAMLRYRLNRTMFEFAVRTGQHASASNRVEYGTGEYAISKAKSQKRAQENAQRKEATEIRRDARREAEKKITKRRQTTARA